MKVPKENPKSQYRNISWTDGRNKTQAYAIGQSRTAGNDGDGKFIHAFIYSIDDTSYKVSGTSEFIRCFTISLITEKDGEVFKFLTVENPVNITYMHNSSQLIKL